MPSKCPRCLHGQMFEDRDGRVSCIQCGHDPQMAWFRENRLPDVPVFHYPAVRGQKRAREFMGGSR